MPYLRVIFIEDEQNPCFIHTEKGGTRDSKKGKGAEISAKQLGKGLKRGHTTYVSALVQIKLDVMVEVSDVFDFIWVHRSGRENQVADALSRKEVQGYVLDGLVRRYWVEDNLLHAKGSRLYETHDPQLAGHQGVEMMVALSSATGMSPEELCMGFQPLTPLELIECNIESLAKAARRMKKYVEKNRWPLEFNVGDKVLLKLTPQIWKTITHCRYHKGLIQRYDGPFVVEERVGSVACRLTLLDWLKIYPTFHMSFLKPFHEDGAESSRVQQKRAPPKILDNRNVGESKLNRRTDYLLQWKGETESEATWERTCMGTRIWALVWTDGMCEAV
ncbi:hypothetical protein ACOSQ4_013331 [Xanthoceras sorbifolium]